MSDWDSLADDIALAWWIGDNDKARDEATRADARAREDLDRAAREHEAADAAHAREWAFRREVALHSAPLAAQRWEAHVSEFAVPDSESHLDEAAVQYLGTLGFTERAAIAALDASGWRGATTEERTIEAILTPPPASR